MVPTSLRLETMDELLGVGLVQLCCAKQHYTRFLDRHSGATIGEVRILDSQKRGRARNIQTFRVVMHVRALRPK